MIELVVFDLAGTTVEEGDAIHASFEAAVSGAGMVPDRAAVTAVMGLPKPEAIRMLLASAGRPVVEVQVAALHADFVRRMCDHYASDPSVREVPGARSVFAALRRAGVKVALNTGFSRPITDVLLARLGWGVPEVIDATVTSDEVPRGRPHPNMIQALMKRLGVTDARRVAKVGDTRADLEEGTNAGCGLVIGVTTGSYTRAQLDRYPHTHLLESVAEVPELVLSGAGGQSDH
ncbi:MAG TPA: phosphonatase-like hydrolase [Gemmataceae bacterium]|nr:phosphonatase-like hydrolase [Gemmataceae bacterium]